MKILYLAFACNPFSGSEAQCGWSWPMAMKEYADITVLTREENRIDIERFMQEQNINNIKVYYHDIPSWMNIYYKKGKLYHAYYVLWQYSSLKCIKELHNKYHFDYIHQVTLGDFRIINPSYKLKTKFIFGPVGGAQLTPEVFKEYTKNDQKSEIVRKQINNLVVNNIFYKRALNRIEYVFAANKETQVFLQKHMQHPEYCYLLTENGISKNKLQGLQIREKKDVVTLLWAGRMVNRKGLKFLLDVLSIMKTQKEYLLYLVGDGPELEVLKNYAQELNLETKIKFLGKVSYKEMQQIYKKSDIFVFPSLRETTGTVLFEAMSNSLPIITFNQNGADLLIDKSCGIKININQSLQKVKKEFAEGLSKLIESKELREQLGQAGYKLIEEKYTWEDKCEIFKEKYILKNI